ncbi:vomeronasal type-1 receptor 2-like [Ctenodactylus gundi]
MAWEDVTTGMVFLAQVVIGILGNFSVLCHDMGLYFSGYKSKPTDSILRHLTVANSLVILSRGIPEAMAALGLQDFLSDLGCKLVFYAHRVGRGVSMGSTCLLSVFQVITVSSRSSTRADVRPRYIGLANVLCWVFYMLLNIRIPEYISGKWKNVNITETLDFRYCSSNLHDKGRDLDYAGFILTSDALCLGLMTWASGSMVFILSRHKKQMRHVHRTSVSPRASPETRATHSILALVTTFVSFYTLSSVTFMCFNFVDKRTQWLVNTSALINACFPIVSPFILLSRGPQGCRLCSVCTLREAHLPRPIRTM